MGAGCTCVKTSPVVAYKPDSDRSKRATPAKDAEPTTHLFESSSSSCLEIWAEDSGARQMASGEDAATYGELVRAPSSGDSLPASVEATIANDVPRTLLQDKAPLGPQDREALTRMLRALARWDPELSYCQGMNYITRFALLSSGVDHAGDGVKSGSGQVEGSPQPSEAAEADAFWLIACLLWRYGARALFLERTPLLKLYGFCLSRLLQRRLPEAHSALDGLDAVLGFKWFGTLFTTVLPFGVAARAWDLLVRDGLTALLCLALGLCSLLAPALLAAKQEGEEACEVMGRLQKQLPADVTPLLPAGVQAGGLSDEALGAQRLLAAAESQACEAGELEPLLEAWRQERPQDAADLGESFTFLSTVPGPKITKL
mmetsp:Transcript_95319/g.269288  ORF Transcript_95319/g.269288 Transcript_95319/m.269288 type:complete len:373 (-) Transcript_95319:86-1204(-)|eukprot:CAMPEP_0168407494 /NCGR_PEP_ID=MMETSP0228-20121227/26190_1 /TAXON_ID=133427 /ORGANISM="Protoceratium reticulatum, Strain CCCM 535 (=CCMP 1889)" /LENGTH=372 /DNA_ID=CAMNT_0008421163 /DNA_START=1 /DNA_END=1119 /DNA_ORIENTATION=+